MCYRDGPPWQKTRRCGCCRLVLARPGRRACGPMSVMRDHGQARPRRQLSTASRATARASSRRSICRIIPAGCMRMDMLASMNSTARAASARSPAWLISGASLSMCSSRRAQPLPKRRSSASPVSMASKKRCAASRPKPARQSGRKRQSRCLMILKTGSAPSCPKSPANLNSPHDRVTLRHSQEQQNWGEFGRSWEPASSPQLSSAASS